MKTKEININEKEINPRFAYYCRDKNISIEEGLEKKYKYLIWISEKRQEFTGKDSSCSCKLDQQKFTAFLKGN